MKKQTEDLPSLIYKTLTMKLDDMEIMVKLLAKPGDEFYEPSVFRSEPDNFQYLAHEEAIIVDLVGNKPCSEKLATKRRLKTLQLSMGDIEAAIFLGKQPGTSFYETSLFATEPQEMTDEEYETKWAAERSSIDDDETDQGITEGDTGVLLSPETSDNT